MNYHLMVDDKFIDGFINDAESVSAGKNIYIIEGSSTTAKYVKHQLITFVNSLEAYLETLKNSITSNDKIFIHWLHYRLEEFLISLPAKIKIGLFFWGGEIVQDPREAYKKDNYEPITMKYFEKYIESKPRYLNPWKNPVNIIRNFKRQKQFQLRIKKILETKYQILARLDYFLHWNKFDYDWIKTKVPKFNPEFKYHFYEVGMDNNIPKLKNKKDKTLVLWLGNSATLSNNHFDALNLLRVYSQQDIKIICPMSYGDDDQKYTSSVVEYGKEIFGSKFTALTQFIQRSEYFKLFEEVDAVVMYHNRTQGAGNSFAFLMTGKKLFMQEKSTVYQLLKENQANLFFNKELAKMSIEKLRTPLTEEEISHNKKVVEKILDRDKKLETLQSLLN